MSFLVHVYDLMFLINCLDFFIMLYSVTYTGPMYGWGFTFWACIRSQRGNKALVKVGSFSLHPGTLSRDPVFVLQSTGCCGSCSKALDLTTGIIYSQQKLGGKKGLNEPNRSQGSGSGKEVKVNGGAAQWVQRDGERVVVTCLIWPLWIVF